jgi:hypothetical protein
MGSQFNLYRSTVRQITEKFVLPNLKIGINNLPKLPRMLDWIVHVEARWPVCWRRMVVNWRRLGSAEVGLVTGTSCSGQAQPLA